MALLLCLLVYSAGNPAEEMANALERHGQPAAVMGE
jgi:hypothetical protein